MTSIIEAELPTVIPDLPIPVLDVTADIPEVTAVSDGDLLDPISWVYVISYERSSPPVANQWALFIVADDEGSNVGTSYELSESQDSEEARQVQVLEQRRFEIESVKRTTLVGNIIDGEDLCLACLLKELTEWDEEHDNVSQYWVLNALVVLKESEFVTFNCWASDEEIQNALDDNWRPVY